MEEIRQASVYGVRPERSFRDAAIEYAQRYKGVKKSFDRDAQDISAVDPYIGDMPLRMIHNGTLQRFILARKKEGVKSGTVNRTLAVVRQILNLCAREWRDEYGLTWLETAPAISGVDWQDKRKPYPITWKEQDRLFSALADHLREAALFAVNTGCREQEICQLRWEWEVPIAELKTSVFVLPDWATKGGKERVVALNSVAMAVVNRQRGKHSEFVFTYKTSPVQSLNNNGWQRARESAGLRQVRFHDLRHTVGRRLRAAGIGEETRADILGHERGGITTHYSIAEISELIEAVEKIAYQSSDNTPSLTLIRLNNSRKTHSEGEKKGLSI